MSQFFFGVTFVRIRNSNSASNRFQWSKCNLQAVYVYYFVFVLLFWLLWEQKMFAELTRKICSIFENHIKLIVHTNIRHLYHSHATKPCKKDKIINVEHLADVFVENLTWSVFGKCDVIFTKSMLHGFTAFLNFKRNMGAF